MYNLGGKKIKNNCPYAVWAAPGALRGLFHVRVEADHMVCPGAGVTQDYLTALLADFTVVLVVSFISITIVCLCSAWKHTISKQPLRQIRANSFII